MDAGAGASMLIFFSLCILQVVIGSAVLSYAAHSFLTIIVDTAAGTDHVSWPREPFTDWLWKPWYLAWLVAVWLTPLAFILGLARFTGFQIVLVSLIFFWLVFPLGLLSSLSASTRWAVFRPVIAWYFLRHLPTTIVFYVATELLIAAWMGMTYYTWRNLSSMLLTPLPALIATAVLFLYARLVGRLAWVINQRSLGKQEELEEIAAETDVQDPWAPRDNANEDEADPAPKPPKPRRAGGRDPWAVPAPEDDPAYWQQGLPLEVRMAGTYDVQSGAAPPAPPTKTSQAKMHAPSTYAAETVTSAKPDTAWLADQMPAKEQVAKERELIEREPESPPAWPMFSGVYTFVFYPGTVVPLLAVAFGLWLMGLVLRMQLGFFILK